MNSIMTDFHQNIDDWHSLLGYCGIPGPYYMLIVGIYNTPTTDIEEFVLVYVASHNYWMVMR